jgi:hypothetical protein
MMKRPASGHRDPTVTDREMLLHLIAKLGLKPEDGPDPPDFTGYADRPASIAIGAGEDGYSGFYAEFHFDVHGNITSHAILE